MQYYTLYDLTVEYSIFSIIPVYFALIWILIRTFKGGGKDD